MAIPETQLERWSHRGAVVGSMETHESIRHALDQHTWPNRMNHDAYLQGSYPNYTNIRGNSDVDLVIESSNVFYSNLNEDEKRQLNIGIGHYSYWDFRYQVVMALKSRYGTNLVDDSGQKSIKIASPGTSNRLNADAVPCIAYRHYHNLSIVAEGIAFQTPGSNQWIVNYPKLHLRNGSNKNSRTNMHYKPAIRMFKNARERMLENDPSLEGNYPSYFIECLLYNVPDDRFSNSFASTYCDVVNFLLSQNSQNLAEFWCQNGQLRLFGDYSTQWDIPQAQDFISRLLTLWQEWQ